MPDLMPDTDLWSAAMTLGRLNRLFSARSGGAVARRVAAGLVCAQ